VTVERNAVFTRFVRRPMVNIVNASVIC